MNLNFRVVNDIFIENLVDWLGFWPRSSHPPLLGKQWQRTEIEAFCKYWKHMYIGNLVYFWYKCLTSNNFIYYKFAYTLIWEYNNIKGVCKLYYKIRLTFKPQQSLLSDHWHNPNSQKHEKLSHETWKIKKKQAYWWWWWWWWWALTKLYDEWQP